jgi:hypothetical protein
MGDIFNRPISEVTTKLLVIKTEYTPTAVIQMANKCNCRAYDWSVKDE